LTDESRIQFHPLEILHEDDEYVIGRKQIGSFISLPEIGIKAINLLDKGLSIKKVKNILEEEYAEEIEIEEFVETLIEVGFIKKVDNHFIQTEHEEINAYFSQLKQEYAKILFSRPAYCTYATLIVTAMLLLVFHPEFFPSINDFMFTDSYTIVLLTTLVLGWIFIFKHEFFHLAAAKSLGLEAQFRISHRLYFIVAETDITSVWTIPRKKRYRVYFAGIISDLLVISILIILLWLSSGSDHLVMRLCRTIILLQSISLVWQCLFFMQTDVYYILTNYLNCKNLFADTRGYLGNIVNKIWTIFPPYDLSAIPEREMRIVKIYSVFFVGGNCIAIGILFYYIIPRAVHTVFRITENVNTSFDNMAFVGILCFNIILLIRSIRREVL